MATGDMRIFNPGGHVDVPTWKFQTDAGDSAIAAGDPVKLKSAGSPYVIGLATGDLTIGTDTQMCGVAAGASDHTASADGTIDVYLPVPGSLWAMKATTAANVDTEAKILALTNDRVVMTLASTVYTLDEDAGDGTESAFYIRGGDPRSGELYFSIRADATILSGESV